MECFATFHLLTRQTHERDVPVSKAASRKKCFKIGLAPTIQVSLCPISGWLLHDWPRCSDHFVFSLLANHLFSRFTLWLAALLVISKTAPCKNIYVGLMLTFQTASFKQVDVLLKATASKDVNVGYIVWDRLTPAELGFRFWRSSRSRKRSGCCSGSRSSDCLPLRKIDST